MIKTEATSVGNIHKQKSPPELVLHCAASLVTAGDLTAKNPADRQDKAGEICQFCVQVPAKFVGRLHKINIDEAFDKMKEATLAKLRQHGVMKAGE